MTKVGSSPPSASTLAIRLVVVVLPCVPAMAMPCFKRISSASISARGTTGIPCSRAATTSGLSARHGSGDDHDVGLGGVVGRVTEIDARAELGEPPQSPRRARGPSR